MPTIEFCREQQRRAAAEYEKQEPADWARLALFDAFTEELLLEGYFAEEANHAR